MYIVGYTAEADAIVMRSITMQTNYDMYIVQLYSMEYKELDGQFMKTPIIHSPGGEVLLFILDEWHA